LQVDEIEADDRNRPEAVVGKFFKRPMQFEIVTNPYPVSASPLDTWSEDNIPSIVVQGEWSDDVENFVRQNQVQGLYLNTAKGWKGTEYGFLDRLDWLQLLDVLSGEKINLFPVSRLSNLRRLRITSGGGARINFAALNALKRCSLRWWTGARSVFECGALESLSIDRLPAKESEGLTRLQNLRDLTIYSQSITSLNSIAHLTNLQKLELNRFRDLKSLDGIENLQSLRSLTINECDRLSDLAPLSALTNLEHLVVSDWGTIDTLAPIVALKKLRALSFSGARTTIADGDLSPLDELPQLSMLMFGPRRHYSHKLIKHWDWNNFDNPDSLLARKKRETSG
jgi:internalin A